MNNNTSFKLFLILIIALFFRLWFLDKPEGLWNDEYVSWFIASQKDFSQFFSVMFKNCHTPFYYFFLKLWMIIFKDSDISLRLSSVFISVLNVFVMYFTGKELKNTNLGLLCAFLTAISSFNIYFAQEVRLYSLIFFFSSLTILFFIKTLKKQSKKNLLLYFIFNAFLCTTHTLGIIFSSFSILILSIYLYKYNDEYKSKFKNIIKIFKYIFPFLIVIAIISPFLYTIAFSNSLSQFWSYFSISKIFFNLSDYFSPIQINIINSPVSVYSYININNTVNYAFIVYGILPVIIGVTAIVNAIKQNNKILNALLITAGLFYLILIVLAICGKIVLITKYSCEIYPVLILALSFGLYSIKQKKYKIALSLLYIGLNLSYLLLSDYCAPKLSRPEGNRAVVKLLESTKLKSTDYVLLTYYDSDKFEKYLKSKNQYKFKSVNKFNFNYIIFNDDDYFKTIKYGKELYKDKLKEFPNKNIIDYARNNFTDIMRKGDRLGIIFLNSVSFISNEEMQKIIEDKQEYNRVPFVFLSFSALRNSLLYAFDDNFEVESVTTSGDWTLMVLKKID